MSDPSSSSQPSLSPDDIAYERALSTAKEKHGTNPIIHQQQPSVNTENIETMNNKSSKNEGKEKMGGEEEEDEREAEGGENISEPSSNIVNQSTNIGVQEEEEGTRVSDAPLGTGGGGGASSGVMNITRRDIEGRIRQLEELHRHPLPKLRDPEFEPKAIASTFNPPPHLPPSDGSGYRPHTVNEHTRKGGGKAPHSAKMIMQPGGKYGQRY